jgi:membrane protein DedA with SNARE-associated domain
MLLPAKFVPGLNAVAAPLAGTIRIPWWQFAAIDSLGICIWAALQCPLGMKLSMYLSTLAAGRIIRERQYDNRGGCFTSASEGR